MHNDLTTVRHLDVEGVVMRRAPIVVPVLLVLVLGLLPGRFAAAQDAADEHVLRIEKNGYPETLDPQVVWDISQEMVVGLGFEGLTRIDEELATVPAAAESWAFSPDGLTLTFHLRDGLTYSDGSPLTAERFRYAIERTCDPRLDSLNASFLFAVVGCEDFFTSLEAGDGGATPDPGAYEAARAALGVRAVDDRTLEIRFTQPASYFPSLASMTMFFPARQELIEAGGEAWWRDPANLLGNGPFQFIDLGNETDTPSKIVYAANARYWAGRPKLDRIEYILANEPRTGAERIAAYQRGEFDMLWLGYDDLPAIESDPVLSRDFLQTPRAATIHLAFNTAREPFTDLKVREAFAYGFDREAFCRVVQHGFCRPTLHWIDPGVPGAIETDAFAFDPEKAREALAASSYGGPAGLPEVTWYYSANEGAEGLGSRLGAEWMAAQYRAVLGVELNLVPVADDEWDAIFGDAATYPQWGDQGWFQAYPDPQYWLSVYWTCDAEFNQYHYCNPALDALLDRADAELDTERRLALYQEAERMLVADVPSIFLFNWAEAMLIKPAVTGYAVTAIDHFPGWTTPLTIDVER
jgi:oligopeptide transport system substrate-binding protein